MEIINSLKTPVGYRLNSSNQGKIAEYQRYLGADIQAETKDLKEPAADALTIIRYKASQFREVLVDDVSLEIEGAEIGVNIKWHLNRLEALQGSRAVFQCLIARRLQDKIEVFEGRVPGKIVSPRGVSFGFNPYFQPDGASMTLAEKIIDPFNARYLALQKLVKNAPDHVLEPLEFWTGDFQE